MFIGFAASTEDIKPKRKVLFLTKSAGFMHDVVNRKKAFTFDKGHENWTDLTVAMFGTANDSQRWF